MSHIRTVPHSIAPRTRCRLVDRRRPRRHTDPGPVPPPPAAAAAMRRTGSMQDVKAFVKHFPEHLSWRAERESFAHEAAQYALWVPFALGANKLGFETLSYLFATWFVLGEAMLLYMHASKSKVLRALRWWHVVGAIAIAASVAGVPVRRTFGRFVLEYVFFGALVMACVFPLIPKAFRRDVPDMIYALGFLKKKKESTD